MKRRRSRRGGFTLLEVLLVLVILVILGSTATMFIRGAGKKARYNVAKAQIAAFEDALQMYELDYLSYPSSSEGLQALVTPPNGGDPFLDKQIPLDPWGNPYQYALISPEQPRIWSMGQDGTDGTADDVANTN
jgi:general secretion pathway protein G